MKHPLPIFILLALSILAFSSKKQPLAEPSPQTFTDDPEKIVLAQNQKFTLPITTRTITHSLEMSPENTNQCQFTSEPLIYRSLGSTSLSNQDEADLNMLTLNKKQKLFVVDQQNNIISYSLDQHYLLKKLAPKTTFAGISKKVTSLALTATEDEQFVYLITPERYYIFTVDSLGLQILREQPLDGNLKDVQKAFTYKGNLVLLSIQAGILVYKIDKTTKSLTLAQRFTYSRDLAFADMQFDKTTQMIYLLALNQPLIIIYHYQPQKFPNPDKSLTIFVQYDSITLDSVTNKHNQANEERNIHIDIEISRNREQQTLMVLFMHNYHYVIAQVYYDINLQIWSFVRYYKFTTRVIEIHIIKDVVAVVGSQSMGLFPFGIHPRLIDEEFNGVMTLTSMLKLKILQNGRFVGITQSTIQYGVISLQQTVQMNCKIQPESKLKSVKLRANLTACTNQDRQLYENYCAYQKTFLLEEMQLSVIAPIADTMWSAMLVFILLIILGICILFAMQRRKERQIKRLQVYFQQKKKNNQPSPTDRRTINDL